MIAIVSQSAFVTDGPKVRLLRDRAGYTLRKFAAELRVHPAYLSKVERGERQPGIELRNRIATALGVPLDDIAELREPAASAAA